MDLVDIVDSSDRYMAPAVMQVVPEVFGPSRQHTEQEMPLHIQVFFCVTF